MWLMVSPKSLLVLHCDTDVIDETFSAAVMRVDTLLEDL